MYGLGRPANGAILAFFSCAATHAPCAAACLPVGTTDVTRPSGANVTFTLHAIPFGSLQVASFGASASNAVCAFLPSNGFVTGVRFPGALAAADAGEAGDGFPETATGALIVGEGGVGGVGLASDDDTVPADADVEVLDGPTDGVSWRAPMSRAPMMITTVNTAPAAITAPSNARTRRRGASPAAGIAAGARIAGACATETSVALAHGEPFS